MVINNNSDLSKEFRDVGKLTDFIIPNQIDNKIIPVIDINPKHSRIANIVRNVGSTASGATTIYATPSDKDFYLTNATLNCMKDAASDNTNVTLTVYIDGAQRQLFSFAFLSLTAERASEVLTFNPPIKLDRGRNIEVNGSYTVGNLSKRATIVGYEIENINA